MQEFSFHIDLVQVWGSLKFASRQPIIVIACPRATHQIQKKQVSKFQQQWRASKLIEAQAAARCHDTKHAHCIAQQLNKYKPNRLPMVLLCNNSLATPPAQSAIRRHQYVAEQQFGKTNIAQCMLQEYRCHNVLTGAFQLTPANDSQSHSQTANTRDVDYTDCNSSQPQIFELTNGSEYDRIAVGQAGTLIEHRDTHSFQDQ
ncbi:hypothetical protein N9L19_01010 [bacterium]|nr:hypothetical protein [bacterium]